jgi:hypothetical protein
MTEIVAIQLLTIVIFWNIVWLIIYDITKLFAELFVFILDIISDLFNKKKKDDQLK